MYSTERVELVEVDSISHNWKLFHIVGLVAAAFFGIVSGISLSSLYEDVEPLCGTASLSVVTSDALPNGRIAVINGKNISLTVSSAEGFESTCSFIQYTFICSFIFASIWMVFFLMCGAGGKSSNGLPQPWRIVPPATIFSFLYFCVVLGAGAQMSIACDKFCSSFDQSFAQLFNITDSSWRRRCQDTNLFPISLTGLNIQVVMQLAQITGWLCVASWAFTVALCLARLLIGPDFRPLLKPVPEAISVKNMKKVPDSGYKQFRNPPGPSVASSSTSSAPGPIAGTSKVQVHFQPTTKSK